MPIVRFSDRFTWQVRKHPRVTRVYKKGSEHQVTQQIADAVIHAGRGEVVTASPPEAAKKTAAKK